MSKFWRAAKVRVSNAYEDFWAFVAATLVVALIVLAAGIIGVSALAATFSWSEARSAVGYWFDLFVDIGWRDEG